MRAARARTRLLSSAAVVLAGLALAAPANATSYRQETIFGSAGTGPGQFSQPQGIALDPQDAEIFVADSNNNRVQVFNSQGVFERQFGSLGNGAGQFNIPEGVGVSPVAPFDVYIADTNNNRVERFTNDGTFVSAFGTSGAGPGQLEFPRNIAFDPQGNVYVGDTGANNRVTKWAADGTFQNVVSGFGTFQQLGGLAASATRLWATDARANTASGVGFDGTGGTTLQSGVLLDPQGLAANESGGLATVYVADAGHHRIAVFDGAGPLVTTFGNLVAPSSVAWSDVTKRVYVLEGNNSDTSVSVWQPVPDPVLGRSMDIQVDTGKVFYKPPGAKKFKPLTKVSLVRSGTIIDARRGTVSITSITSDGTLQSADFFKGIFRAVQKKSDRGRTDAVLVGGNFKACKKASSAKGPPKQGKKVRQLWASAHGQFRTVGRFLAATVRGTDWQTSDSCKGSLVKVTAGSVLVSDFLLHRQIVVNAGGFYAVNAPHA